MPEPLKNRYSVELVTAIGVAVHRHHAAFDQSRFLALVFDRTWPERELKARMSHIAQCWRQTLPGHYPIALAILVQAANEFSGLTHMCFPEFVGRYGLDHYDESIAALGVMTANSSAEFAVRPFIQTHPEQMMQQMATWAESDDLHQRRLASEGCRPRLPWAMALPEFKSDPAPILPILQKLKADESLYVRRSVANNLNDIAKDNPAIVVGIAQRWLGESPEVDWVVKHACRSLLKQARPQVLALFGYGGVEHLELGDLAVDASVQMGDKLNFSFTLTAAQGALGKLRIEYAIDFVKHNGQQSRKIFKVSESLNSGAEKTVSRSFSFRPISTRNYYPGLHRLSAIVNGQVLAGRDFQLLP